MKTILKFLLALFMARVPAQAAEPTPVEEPKDTFNYVAIGSSTIDGYGLKGFVPEEFYENPAAMYQDGGAGRDGYYSSGFVFTPEGAAPKLIAEALQEEMGDEVEVNFNNLCMNSFRAYDLAYMLGELPEDGYINWRLGNGENSGWIYDIERARDGKYAHDEMDLRQYYKDSIANADLISYDLGANDFGVYIANMLIDDLYTNDVYEILDDESAAIYSAVYTALMLELSLILKTNVMQVAFTCDSLVSTFAYAFVGFIQGFNKAMEYIYEVNPDAEVVVCSIQNLFKGFKSEGDIDIAKLYLSMITLANSYMRSYSPYAGKYYFADFGAKGNRVEFFIDDLANWNPNDELPEEIADSFNVFEKKLLVRSRMEALVASQYGAARNVEPYKSQADYIRERATSLSCWGLARAVQLASVEPTLSLEAIMMSEYALTGLADLILGNTVAGISAEYTDEQIKAYNEAAIAQYFEEPGMADAVVVGCAVSFANCFFFHPCYEGHVEMAQMILDAYHNKATSRKQAASNFINEIKSTVKGFVNCVVEEIKDAAKDYQEEITERAAGEREIEIPEEVSREEFEAVVEQYKEEIKEEIINPVKEAVEEVKEKVEETIHDFIEENIDPIIDPAVDEIKEFIEEKKEEVATALKEELQRNYEPLKEDIQEVLDVLDEVAEEHFEEYFLEPAETKYEEGVEAAEASYEFAKEMVKEVIKDVALASVENKEAIMENEEIAQKVEEKLEEAVPSYIEAASGFIGKIIGLFGF